MQSNHWFCTESTAQKCTAIPRLSMAFQRYLVPKECIYFSLLDPNLRGEKKSSYDN